jgi:NADH-quinone oxidoreductase subunit N
MARDGDTGHQISDYRGLARRQPALALAFAVLLLGQAGAPFTTGFLAKFGVVGASVDTHAYTLAVIAMVTAAIAAFFYLRVAITMFSPVGAVGNQPDGAPQPSAVEGSPSPGGRSPTSGRLPDPTDRPVDRVDPVYSLQLLTDAPPTEEVTERGLVAVPPLTSLVIGVTVAFSVVFGIIPGPILDFAHQATLLFT